MAATAVTLNDLEGHSPVAGVFKGNPSNICADCASLYTISTDSVLARFLCISRAFCQMFRFAQHIEATSHNYCSLLLAKVKLTRLFIVQFN